MTKMLSGALICITLCTSSFYAINQENIIAEGSGIGVSHDEALLAAKRDAVEKVLEWCSSRKQK